MPARERFPASLVMLHNFCVFRDADDGRLAQPEGENAAEAPSPLQEAVFAGRPAHQRQTVAEEWKRGWAWQVKDGGCGGEEQQDNLPGGSPRRLRWKL
jgi:hypothetical protein